MATLNSKTYVQALARSSMVWWLAGLQSDFKTYQLLVSESWRAALLRILCSKRLGEHWTEDLDHPRTWHFSTLIKMTTKNQAPPRFELGISCLLDRRFNQLSHGANASRLHEQQYKRYPGPHGATGSRGEIISAQCGTQTHEKQGTFLSIRIVSLILPSYTLFGDDLFCICSDYPNRETVMLSNQRP